MKIIEKHHRLPKELYIGEKMVSFTCCIKNRSSVFNNEKIFNEFEEQLLTELIKFGCDSLIHLFMPDHLHSILKGNNSNSEVMKAVNE